ncbi:MAG TPA: efflux RND transporter periplasmic adaptor subunit [Candidatus Acidoferrales bacterium]|nr:efflux RND transporter periplasmic adaptor subunit [Candidatus Acidoferrales bacterium]
MSVSNLPKAKKPILLDRLLGLSLWKKGLIIIVIIVVIWFAWARLFGQKSTSSQYQTATAQRASIIATVSESGNVSADSQTSVTSPATGIVQDVYVKNGDTVTEGQKLFSVKSTATPEEKATAYASYLTAQNTLNTAQSKMNSLQSALFKANQTFINDKGVPNPTDLQKQDPVYIEENADWLQAEADYKNQAGVISQAQAALQSASLSYQATQNATVTAPVGGTVANLSVSAGSSVTASNNNSNSSSSSSSNSSSTSSSSSSNSSSSTVLVIGNFSNLSVVAQVNEVDLPSIKVGQNATVTLDAFPNQTFVGKVVNVDSIGTSSSGVVTYNVYIDLVSPPSEIKSGMTASVNIQTARADNVITVPTAAVQTSNGSSYVRVLKNGQLTEVPVTTGISDDTNTEISSGISEGDTVVIGTSTTTSGSSSTASPFSGAGGRGGGGGAVFFRRGG